MREAHIPVFSVLSCPLRPIIYAKVTDKRQPGETARAISFLALIADVQESFNHAGSEKTLTFACSRAKVRRIWLRCMQSIFLLSLTILQKKAKNSCERKSMKWHSAMQTQFIVIFCRICQVQRKGFLFFLFSEGQSKVFCAPKANFLLKSENRLPLSGNHIWVKCCEVSGVNFLELRAKELCMPSPVAFPIINRWCAWPKIKTILTSLRLSEIANFFTWKWNSFRIRWKKKPFWSLFALHVR